MSRLPCRCDAIRTLADILQDTGLTEIEIAENDSRIRVVRAPATHGSDRPDRAGHGRGRPLLATIGHRHAEHARITRQHPGAVKSPMVGVAFLSPEPGSAPFVTIGQQSVAAGQTLLLIEAMKTFNQIKAPRSGTISRVSWHNPRCRSNTARC